MTGEWITQTIVSEIKKARFFTVLADETVDISNTEQISIVLRYVDIECNIKEDFIQFTSCTTCNSMHYDLEINYDDVIDMFARMHPRRMALQNILHDDA